MPAMKEFIVWLPPLIMKEVHQYAKKHGISNAEGAVRQAIIGDGFKTEHGKVQRDRVAAWLCSISTI